MKSGQLSAYLTTFWPYRPSQKSGRRIAFTFIISCSNSPTMMATSWILSDIDLFIEKHLSSCES